MNFNKKRWIYLCLSMLIVICSGIGYTWSVFQGPLIEHFHWDLSAASLIFTVQIAMSTLTPILFGRYQTRLGTRNYLLCGALVYGLGLIGTGYSTHFFTFLLSFSVGVGAGIGMLYPCLMGYGVRIMPKRRGLATGLLAGSYSVGALIWAPSAVSLQGLYGIMAVYKIFGTAFVIVILISAWFIRDPDESDSANHSRKLNTVAAPKIIERDWRAMLRTPKFYMLLSLFSLGTGSGLMIIGHASAILVENLHILDSEAAFLVGLISISNALGPIVWGIVSDHIGRFKVLVSLFFIVFLSMLTLYSAHSSVVFVAAIITTCFAYGGFVALIAPATADVFGSRHVNVNYGFLYTSFGIGGIIGPQIAAITKNSTGTYSLAFLIISGCCIVGATLAFLIFKPEKSVANLPSQTINR